MPEQYFIENFYYISSHLICIQDNTLDICIDSAIAKDSKNLSKQYTEDDEERHCRI